MYAPRHATLEAIQKANLDFEDKLEELLQDRMEEILDDSVNDKMEQLADKVHGHIESLEESLANAQSAIDEISWMINNN